MMQVFSPAFTDLATSTITTDHLYKTHYLASLNFAITKNIPSRNPPIFVNGIPISMDALESTVSQVIQEEQYRLAVLVGNRKISDRTKSIYAKLLTGEGVYDRYHVLLSEGSLGGRYEEGLTGEEKFVVVEMEEVEVEVEVEVEMDATTQQQTLPPTPATTAIIAKLDLNTLNGGELEDENKLNY